MKYLPKLLHKAIHKGSLTLKGPNGFSETYHGAEPGPAVTICVHDISFDWKIFSNPELRAAEAFMAGALTVDGPESGTGAWDLLRVFFINKRSFDLTPSQIFWRGIARRAKRFAQHNPVVRSRQNVKVHYDLGNALYEKFLCDDMQYSCAYFQTGNETLDEAQTAKKRHISAKLCLKPGQRVLDIGCGWGGMALYIAHAAEDVHVTGVTLSEEQLKVARGRADALGVSDRVTFKLCDYRHVTETFDRVVSVGMLEHVGITQLTPYFLNVRDRLAPNGIALIHSISSKAPPGVTGPFLRKYIFPGGYSPSLSEATASLEKSGLWMADCEIWRVHYAETLRHWREKFEANRTEIEAMYTPEFGRMWEFYLAACEGAFRYGASNVFQMQLARERDVVPLTRDYMAAEEQRLKTSESKWLGEILASSRPAIAM